MSNKVSKSFAIALQDAKFRTASARATLYANLAREPERELTTVRALQKPQYGQVRTESRLFRAPSRCHLKFPTSCVRDN